MLPEATRPLLRQIEAMQAANAANAAAWAAAERSLHDRLSSAEAHAAAASTPCSCSHTRIFLRCSSTPVHSMQAFNMCL